MFRTPRRAYTPTSTAGVASGQNRERTAILESALTYAPFESLSPKDAVLLASRYFTVEELARLYQVPPPMIGNLTHGTLTNFGDTPSLLRAIDLVVVVA